MQPHFRFFPTFKMHPKISQQFADRLIVLVLFALSFVWTAEAVTAAEEVVIFSGQSVVEYTGKGNALKDSTQSPPDGGKSVRIEFWRSPHSIVIGPKRGADSFSPAGIDWDAQDLAFEYQTEGVPKILSLSIMVPVGGGLQEAVVLNNAPALMNLSIDGRWHTAVVNVDGWQKAFKAALDAKKIPEGALVGARIGVKVVHNGSINISNLRVVPKKGGSKISPTPESKPTPVSSPLAKAPSKSVKADNVSAQPQKLESAHPPRKVKAIVQKEVQKRQSASIQAPSVAKAAQTKAASGNGTPNITITKKSPASSEQDKLDEYSKVRAIPDAVEPLNRGFFWFNHQLYTFVFRPVSKVYGVIPKQARAAIFNVYDNVEFPVRFVNDLLQLKFKRADLEARKFLVNSVAGVGGIMRVSDRIPALANVPPADTAQTLAKWGVGHGCYIVLPVFGPSSLRDTVGLVGDYALSPVTWVSFGGVPSAAALAVTGPNSVRNMDGKLNAYDAATQNAVDPYQAVRSGYSQYREKAVAK